LITNNFVDINLVSVQYIALTLHIGVNSSTQAKIVDLPWTA